MFGINFDRAKFSEEAFTLQRANYAWIDGSIVSSMIKYGSENMSKRRTKSSLNSKKLSLEPTRRKRKKIIIRETDSEIV